MASDSYIPSINCRGKLLDFSIPRIMGILNVTPDSFFDGGKFMDIESASGHALELLGNGADMIDVGGCSTRPGSKPVSEKAEINRVAPVIKLIHKMFPDAIISVDTFRSRVARFAVEAGASMVNDISGGCLDKAMFRTVAELKTPYVLMHIRGTPRTMQKKPVYRDIILEMVNYFRKKIFELQRQGIHDIIIDPGFGFGKTTEHNYKILNRLEDFHLFGLPIMAGLSRKSMVNKVLGVTPGESLNGTTVLHTIALLKGANILRVHDVKEAKEAITLYGRL